MVDLVKLRKKAKEKQEEHAASNDGGAHVATETLPAPVEDPAVAEPEASAPPAAPKKEKARPEAKRAAAPASQPPEPKPAGESKSEAKPETKKDEAPVGDAAAGDRLEAFKQTAGTRQNVQGDVADLRGDENQVELLTFVIGREQYAISIEKIVEIIPPQNATRVPNAPASVVGIISLRGTIVTILDLRRRLGHAAAAHGVDSRIIVVENKGETAGFVVDRVLRVIKTDPSKIESHPVVSPTEQSDHILGVFQHGKSLSIYLDLDRLLQD